MEQPREGIQSGESGQRTRRGRHRQWLAALVAAVLGLVLLDIAFLTLGGDSGRDSSEHAAGLNREESNAAPSKAIRRRAAAHRRWRASRAARGARTRSRTAYADLDRRGTAALMRKEFASTLKLADSLVQPEHVKRYTSDYTAIVDSGPGATAAGGSALAVSSLPLRAASASGQKQPLDLSLRARGGGLEPVNALADFALPRDLANGIRLPQGISLSVASGEPSGVAPSRVGSSTALYPEVDLDTDLLASSTPRGVELFRLMRSPQSPDTQELRLKLPAGAALEQTRNGGASVVQDKKPLLSISAASATDAQGERVPATMKVAGDTLRITVAHRGGDWAYPILVDPAVETYQSTDFPGWVGFNNGPYSLSFDCMFGRSCFGPGPGNYTGLNIYAWNGNWYSGAQIAGFGYRVPGDRSTFVDRAILGWVGYYNGEAALTPYMYMGLYDYSYGENANQFFNRSWWLGTIDLLRLGDSPMVKEVNVQLNNTPWEHRFARGDHHAYVGAATIYLDDPDSPGFGSIMRPPWVDQQPKPIPLTVSDAGLGIGSLRISGVDQSGNPVSWQTAVGCAGGNRSPCPKTWSSPANGSVNYDPSVLPQGINNLNVTALDAGGHGEHDEYRLVAKHSSKCMDVRGSRADGAAIVQWDCASTTSKTFALVPSSPGHHQLVNRHSGKCVDVTGVSTAAGAQLQQYSCLGPDQANQQWKLVPSGDGYDQIVAKHSGQCADVSGASTDNGAALSQYTCHGGANQLWRLDRVSRSFATAQVRVDHTDPTLDLSGSLVDAVQDQGAGQ